MAKTAKGTQKTRIFCDPDVKDFLCNDWLLTGYIDGNSNLPKLLEGFGMYGYITAFFKTDTDISFAYDKKITTIRFFNPNIKNEENECLLEGNLTYDNSFAVIDKSENSWTFYDADYYFLSVIPRFKNYRFTNGKCSREISKNAETLQNTFKVDKLKGAIFMHITIPNDDNSVYQLDNKMCNILDVLNSGNPRDVCLKYDKLKNQIKKFSRNFDIIYQANDNQITDAIFVREGRVIEYILSFDGKKISLDRHYNWEYIAPGMRIIRKGREISFEGTTDEFELPNVKALPIMVKEIMTYIQENMLFVF